jgi:hypothetical protein
MKMQYKWDEIRVYNSDYRMGEALKVIKECWANIEINCNSIVDWITKDLCVNLNDIEFVPENIYEKLELLNDELMWIYSRTMKHSPKMQEIKDKIDILVDNFIAWQR